MEEGRGKRNGVGGERWARDLEVESDGVGWGSAWVARVAHGVGLGMGRV